MHALNICVRSVRKGGRGRRVEREAVGCRPRKSAHKHYTHPKARPSPRMVDTCMPSHACAGINMRPDAPNPAAEKLVGLSQLKLQRVRHRMRRQAFHAFPHTKTTTALPVARPWHGKCPAMPDGRVSWDGLIFRRCVCVFFFSPERVVINFLVFPLAIPTPLPILFIRYFRLDLTQRRLVHKVHERRNPEHCSAG